MPIPRSPNGHPQRTAVPSLNREYIGALPSPPALLGFKDDGPGSPGHRFRRWRPWQEAAILTSMDAGPDVRCVIECLPTGAGKTLTYMAEALMTGGRTVILTS